MAFTGITLFDFFNLKETEGLKTHFKKFYPATSRGVSFRSEELGNPGILSELAQAKQPLFLHMEAHQGPELSFKPTLLLTGPRPTWHLCSFPSSWLGE